ncbi:beta-1,3-N-acetylglucosaminyltransferase manic fringe-like isoform X2 [Dysidea avara]|uniref:beta-1,3-N-acetylglucosaminyltransferase manic fringe-like isoform X2 n=1 Tax=Dysidea avara TaxID=196820 RepID=UPI003329DA86
MIQNWINRAIKNCHLIEHVKARILSTNIRYYLHVTWLSVSLACVICMLVLVTCDWPQLSTPSNVHRKESPVPKEMNHTHIRGIPMEPVDAKYQNNIFFSVKTTDAYFTTRLLLLMLTWFQVVSKDKLSIVSDAPATDLYVNATRRAGFNLIVSDCVAEHSFRGLCCKTGTEFAAFYKAIENHRYEEESFQWFCHVDDDIYVNVPQLSKLLKQYDPRLPFYIGKFPAVQLRKSLMKVESPVRMSFTKNGYPVKQIHFQYATGATYCISHELMMQAKQYLNGKEAFGTICKLTQYPDDMTVGFIINVLMGRSLTDVNGLATQYDDHDSLKPVEYITISYDASKIQSDLSYLHTVRLVPLFKEDPTRFLTYHCRLFPSVSWCQ